MQLAPRPDAQREREQSEQRAQRRHQDGAEPDPGGFADRRLQRHARFPHPQPGEVEQDDPVLHDQPDEQDEPHEGGDVQRRAGHEQ